MLIYACNAEGSAAGYWVWCGSSELLRYKAGLKKLSKHFIFGGAQCVRVE